MLSFNSQQPKVNNQTKKTKNIVSILFLNKILAKSVVLELRSHISEVAKVGHIARGFIRFRRENIYCLRIVVATVTASMDGVGGVQFEVARLRRGRCGDFTLRRRNNVMKVPKRDNFNPLWVD